MIEGLVSLRNNPNDRRPTASDVLVLTVTTYQRPDVVIAGAKVPIAKIGAFPFRFQMTEKNAVPAPSLNNTPAKEVLSWKEATTTSDLVVNAFVCDRDIILLLEANSGSSSDNGDIQGLERQCRERNATLIRGMGLAKLVRLQPAASGDGSAPTVIRAPVSIVLE